MFKRIKFIPKEPGGLITFYPYKDVDKNLALQECKEKYGLDLDDYIIEFPDEEVEDEPGGKRDAYLVS